MCPSPTMMREARASTQAARFFGYDDDVFDTQKHEMDSSFTRMYSCRGHSDRTYRFRKYVVFEREATREFQSFHFLLIFQLRHYKNMTRIVHSYYKNMTRKSTNSIMTKTRTPTLEHRYRTFVGSEAVSAMIRMNVAVDEHDALRIGNSLLNAGYFGHVFGLTISRMNIFSIAFDVTQRDNGMQYQQYVLFIVLLRSLAYLFISLAYSFISQEHS